MWRHDVVVSANDKMASLSSKVFKMKSVSTDVGCDAGDVSVVIVDDGCGAGGGVVGAGIGVGGVACGFASGIRPLVLVV